MGLTQDETPQGEPRAETMRERLARDPFDMSDATQQEVDLICAFARAAAMRAPKRTRLGLLTYFGGLGWAALQYALLHLALTLGALLLLHGLTGAPGAGAAPLPAFFAGLVILAGAYLLARGVALVAGYAHEPLQIFLDFLFGALLPLFVWRAAADAFGAVFSGSVWFRAGACFLSLLVLTLGAVFLARLTLDYECDDLRQYYNMVLVGVLPPAVVAAVFWVFSLPVLPWMRSAAAIFCFLWVWLAIYLLFLSLTDYFGSMPLHHKLKVKFDFLCFQTCALLLPALGLFLHILFHWFPMHPLVIAAFGIYGVLWLLNSLYFLMTEGA